MKQLKAKILSNRKVGAGFYKMELASSYLAKASRPGQFVEIRCSRLVDPLLRRPLGVHRIWTRGIDLLYEVTGKGTAILSERRAGEELDVIGPLGNGFDLSLASDTNILVAGGIGVAPLAALAESLGAKEHEARRAETCNFHSSERPACDLRLDFRRGPAKAKRRRGNPAPLISAFKGGVSGRRDKKIYALIGAGTKSHIMCDAEFKSMGCDVRLSTDDGSRGYKGRVTEPLVKLLDKCKLETYLPDFRRVTVYACGPTAMLKVVSRIALERGIPCQVSLEERMACGIGVCLGCPVKTKAGPYKMVCKDGPVFNTEELAW